MNGPSPAEARLRIALSASSTTTLAWSAHPADGVVLDISQERRADGQGRVVAMEVLNNTYALSNLIRLRKLEQIYTHLQTRTKDIADERMITLERSLAHLVHSGTVTPLEAEKWANHPSAFLDEMQHMQQLA